MEAILMTLQDGNGVWPWNAVGWLFVVGLFTLGLIEKYEKYAARNFRPPTATARRNLPMNTRA